MAESTQHQNITGLLLSPQVLPFLFLALVFIVFKTLNHTDVPKIKNLPEVPGIPVFGNLIQLGNNHARKAQQWAKQYGAVFQVRMGNRRIVFANTFDSVKHLWITNQSSLISRPMLHTFHSVVSSSEGFTIGTSPWDESCKARRKAAATALNRPAVQSYMPIIDYESIKSLREMLNDSKHGEVDIDPNPYFQRFALSTTLTLTYGARIEGNINDSMLQEITRVERAISNFRSTSNNWADYVPLLRLWPSANSKALEFKKRRAAYMRQLLDDLKQRIADGTDRPCISGNVLKDPDAKLNEAEVLSIGLSMVAAGLDTVPGNLIMCMAYLSSPHGQEIQARALAEIQAQYPANDSWERCLHEEKCPFITALVKETLRFWSIVPICLPRTSIRPITWEGATIPAGTSFYMNAYAANYDDTHFQSPFAFNPDRYLADHTSTSSSLDHSHDIAATQGTPHYGYGAGSRMCIGSHLANRELYTAFLRLITAFEICPPRNPADAPVLDAMGCNQLPNGLTVDPKPFKVGLRVRDRAALERWIAQGEERTKDL